MTNTASLCQILGGLRNRSFNCEIAVEDHSYVATKQERGRNEKSWKLSLNAESIQGPLNQKEAKQTCKILYHKYTSIQSLEMETNQSLLDNNKSGNGLINGLKASKNTITDLNLVQDGDSILPPGRRIHLCHEIGNRAATGSQLGAGIRGKHHPGLNSNFFTSLIAQGCYFACRKFYLLAIEGCVDSHISHAQLLHSSVAVSLS